MSSEIKRIFEEDYRWKTLSLEEKVEILRELLLELLK